MNIKKAIIPAAGLGSRFLPATKAQPKEMLPIVDTPTIQYIVEEAIKSGIECIVIIIGRNKRAIEDHFDKSIELENELKSKGKDDLLNMVEGISKLVDVIYIRQKEPLGLGHAVLTAKKVIGNEPFAVLLGDDIVKNNVPAIKQLIDTYNKYEATILGVQRVPWEETDKYGIIATDEPEGIIHNVTNLIEKPSTSEAPSNLAILGRYIITPEIFSCLEQTPTGKGGEIQLTDALKILLKKQRMYGLEFEGKRYDVGDKLGFLKATCEYALDNTELKDVFSEYLKTLAQQL